MKKTLYLSLIAALLAGGTLTSCSDFLDAENKSAGGSAADNIQKDPDILLTTVYKSLYDYAYLPELYSQGTDLYIMTRGRDAGAFNEYSMTPITGSIESFYGNLYRTVNMSNGVVQFAGETASQSYEARFLRDYAYYMLTQHFGAVPFTFEYINSAERNYPRIALDEIYPKLIEDLTDLYNNSTLANTDHTGRVNKQAVAALLAKICLAAGWDLQTSYTDVVKGKYAKANDLSYFTEAAAWAEKAINGVTLTMSFEDKWSPFNEGNAEEIFSVQYSRANYPGDVTSGGHSMQNNFGGYYGDCTASGIKNVSSSDAQSLKSMYLYEPGDKRYEATYMTTMYNATAKEDGKTANWGTEGYYAYYNVDKAKLANFPIAHRYFPYYVTEEEAEAELSAHQSQYAKGNNITEVTAVILTSPFVTKYAFNADGSVKNKTTQSLADYNVQTSNGVAVKKFDDAESEQYTGSNDYRDIVLFHVSDMYLIAAEAYYMAGNTAAALTKINAVRQRAGLTALQSFDGYNPEYTTTRGFNFEPIDVILDERARELYAEGHRWMDLRRTKQLVRYNLEFNQYVTSVDQMMDVQKTNYKLYRPIPASEIEVNLGMTDDDQNPGY